eukprot:9409959-Prorocentrum_lima.AAC.1
MLEAHGDDYIDTVLSMLASHKHLIDQYLTGELTAETTPALPVVATDIWHGSAFQDDVALEL